MSYTNSSLSIFRKTVLGFYKKHGRAHLPWRKTNNPYRILVSEVMLQQTQVERVIPKYKNFLKKFPTLRALSRAPLSSVLREWQGLGYNRRAKMLHEAVKATVLEHGGVLPRTNEALTALPGIGPYTANAIRVFAFNLPAVLIETNVRSVYLHHFFPRQSKVSDKKLLPLIQSTLDIKNPRAWYSALMDYGSHIKSTVPNPSRKSAHHTQQKPFKGSDREIRGALLRTLASGVKTKRTLLTLHFPKMKLEKQLTALIAEGLAEKHTRYYRLPD